MAPVDEPRTFYRDDVPVEGETPGLKETVRADVCVIGGGFTGISAALHLAERGARVVLVEARTIGFGASGRNGGQIHTGHRQSQKTLERWLGVQHAHDLWTLAEDAKRLLRSLVATHQIACWRKDGLVIAAHNRRAQVELAEETEYLAAHYNYSQARMLDAAGVAGAVGSAIYPGARFDAGGGHLQPLAFVRGLARAARAAGAVIYERTRARAIEECGHTVRVPCEHGCVEADTVLVACDSWSAELLAELAPFIARLESFVIATEPLRAELQAQILPSDAAVADTRHVLDYYRKSHDGRLLFGGRETYLSTPQAVAPMVRPRMERIYPALKDVAVSHAWSGTVGITRTRLPHLGRVGRRVLFAHGYSGQGVALATLGGELLAQAALGQAERFEVLARVPAKPFPGGTWSRPWLVAAGLIWFKLADAF